MNEPTAEKRKNRIPPVVWLGGASLLQAVMRGRRATPARRFLGWAITAGSAALGAWGLRDFGERGTSIDPMDVDKATALVDHGAHGVSRHPMYVAMLGAALGQAVLKGRLKALLPVLALWAGLDAQARDEEDALSEKFGRSYLKYQDRVPKWL